MGEALMVGMAEVKVSSQPEDVFIALGLGSCIGICAYDAQAKVAGMAHIVLPQGDTGSHPPGKFANTAIPELLRLMIEAGAAESHIRIALTGGAQLFAVNSAIPRMDIGPRNIEAVTQQLSKYTCNVVAADIGGSAGRTVHLFGDGRIRVKTIGQGERELATLGSNTPFVPSSGADRLHAATEKAA
ncbi:hypothetical protein LC607_35270 [Nostoc sp. CHAB 5824]|nr:hypothetical protein [Nostoc sp. CHAB 5824]